MRSVVVVLPASICAAMPMLRVRSIVYALPGAFTFFFSATVSILSSGEQKRPGFTAGRFNFKSFLPAEMRESLIGLRHLMHLVTFTNCVSLPLVSIQDFRRERVVHLLS